MKPFIGYHFFHGAGKITPSDAYRRTQRAMSMFTDHNAPSYRGFSLDMRDEQAGPLQSLFHDLCGQFGPPTHTSTSISPPSIPTYRCHYWTLNTEQFERTFSLLEAVNKDIPKARERAYIRASWSFKFVQPETGHLLPGQENMPEIDVRLGPGSSLNLTTGAKTLVNAWFLFPFDTDSRDLSDYVCRFQGELIFKFSPKHWRLWKRYPVRGWWPKKIVPQWYKT